MTKIEGVWFNSDHLRRRAPLKILCFPYAGGTASIYKNWGNILPSTVQVIPVELPGRGVRLNEPPFVSLPALINALAVAVSPLLDTPFTFFGHSMGAVVAFELTRYLRREHSLGPQTLFLSGRRAPQIPRRDPVTYNLPYDEFLKELNRLEGTPREILEHEELMEIMVPLLRADFQLVETYRYNGDIPLQCPITVYGGSQDSHVTEDMLLPWREQTSSRFALHMLPGDHFFLRSSQFILLRLLAQELRELIV